MAQAHERGGSILGVMKTHREDDPTTGWS